MTDISTREVVIKGIKECLESISSGSAFQTQVAKVLRGIHAEDSFSGDLPGLSLWCEKGPRKDIGRGYSERRLLFHIWGYTSDVQAANGNYDALDKLVADVEKALMTETYNSRWAQTYIGDTTYYEGGVDDPIGIFEMLVEVEYTYEYASP